MTNTENNPLKTKLLASEMAKTLSKWQLVVDQDLKNSFIKFGPEHSKLAEACVYALMSGGKRFRPAIVHMVNNALNKGYSVTQAALAVEYFHTASLIADDLPCMDNDEFRRGRPSAHRAYGEGVALLASYALISEGYAAISENGRHLNNGQVLSEALASAAFNTGAHGATGGQYLDLYPPEITLNVVLEVLQKKTVTLFELAFVLGWLFGGGEIDKLSKVKKAAHHFGMAFQIADDIEDFKQDEARGSKINLAVLLGLEQARKVFLKEAQDFREEIKSLQLDKSELADIVEILVNSLT